MREPIQTQTQRILDEHGEQSLNVIVQMEPQRRRRRLSQAAGKALSRRQLTLTPRELLPRSYKTKGGGRPPQETASTRALLGRSTQRAVTRAKLQKTRRAPMEPLLSNDVIRKAVGRMLEPKRKSARTRRRTVSFWTSRSMPLSLSRDELAGLSAIAGVRSVHINRPLKIPSILEIKPLQIESTDTLSSTWGLKNAGVLSAWGSYGYYGEGVTIGVLDTGVDASHPDLEGKVAHWAEFDSLGNAVDSEPHDSDEHGTHCAGTLVGGSESGRSIGVAPDAKLAAGLVLDGEEGGTDAQVLAGIDWAVETGVDVLSMSLGGLVLDAETPPTYTEAILTCMEAGIPVVAAIGNEGHQTSGSPGNDLFALSIGATDPDDRPAGFSGGRTQIIRESDYIDSEYLPLPYSKPDLSAPGVAIYSSVPGGDWKSFSGTSMATPHVAGAIAVLLSATNIRELESGEHLAFLIQDLITGAVEDLGESGQDHRYGFGRLDVLRAIDYAYQRDYGFES